MSSVTSNSGPEAGDPPSASTSQQANQEAADSLSEEALQLTHDRALSNIRKFLSETTAYTILPESFRLIVLDNDLTVKGALSAMTSNGRICFRCFQKDISLKCSCLYLGNAWHLAGVASAPLYDSNSFKFAGMLTYTESVLSQSRLVHCYFFDRPFVVHLYSFIHLIQYYYLTAITYDNAAAELEELKLNSLRGMSGPAEDACSCCVLESAHRTCTLVVDVLQKLNKRSMCPHLR